MQLTYFKGNNFGDELNPYIFERLVPELFDANDNEIFLGIGTLLGFKDLFHAAPKKYVFSTGYGYGEISHVDSSYEFLCVRGPHTADRLKLDRSKAITDGALLLNAFYTHCGDKRHKCSFMPHWVDEMFYDWRPLCKMLDINYISPTDPVESVLEAISASDKIITEAMHGAIVADAFRVPWVAFKSYHGVNSFKWIDWTSSVGLDYKPIKTHLMVNRNDYLKSYLREHRNLRFSASMVEILAPFYSMYRKLISQPKALKSIKKILSDDEFMLSDENVLQDRFEQLQENLYAFCRSR
jgi:succinoglycan biosynthesis protein ExoV